MKRGLSTNVVIIQDTMKRDYEHKASHWKAWTAKHKILERLFDTYEESFQKLPRMLLVIKDSNPGTIVTWDQKMVDGNKTIFGRAFWAFSASNDGF
jgi:hypothetical protein